MSFKNEGMYFKLINPLEKQKNLKPKTLMDEIKSKLEDLKSELCCSSHSEVQSPVVQKLSLDGAYLESLGSSALSLSQNEILCTPRIR